VPTLKDQQKLKFVAGRGGDGAVHFGPMERRPEGGDGGKGGDIYLEGTTNLYDLSYIKRDSTIEAEQGERGGKKNMTGRDGKDIVFKVPLVTIVFDDHRNEILRIEKPGEKKLLLRGGMGGLGNYYFRAGQRFTLEKSTPGRPGEELSAFLELRFRADVIFIGFPNAGKSSILNELSNANSKVAPYAFTTLDPILGTTDERIILMDLPGLIEGTFEGKGLGVSFKKHAETAKILAHFVSLEAEDVVANYKKMRDELTNISNVLSSLPEVIVLTKSDLVDKTRIDESIKKLKKFNKEILVTSAYDFDSLEVLRSKFIAMIDTVNTN
jgi:GTP-binding protein